MAALATEEPDQRGRILDHALGLMSDVGAHAMSMRRLATACGLNPATLYHYFPSKADLLRSVIEERRYPEQLAADPPPVDAGLDPRRRLAVLVEWLLVEGLAEQRIWKLLVGETVRGDPVAREAAAELLELLDGTIAGWLRDGFPELTAEPAAAAVVVRNQLVATLVEVLVVGDDAFVSDRAGEVAETIFPA